MVDNGSSDGRSSKVRGRSRAAPGSRSARAAKGRAGGGSQRGRAGGGGRGPALPRRRHRARRPGHAAGAPRTSRGAARGGVRRPRAHHMDPAQAGDPVHALARERRAPIPLCGARAGPGRSADYFYSSHASIKRSLFERVGGFDARFPTAAVEDTELGVRLATRGSSSTTTPNCSSSTTTRPPRPNRCGGRRRWAARPPSTTGCRPDRPHTGVQEPRGLQPGSRPAAAPAARGRWAAMPLPKGARERVWLAMTRGAMPAGTGWGRRRVPDELAPPQRLGALAIARLPGGLGLAALLAQIHILDVQGPWSTVMVGVVVTRAARLRRRRADRRGNRPRGNTLSRRPVRSCECPSALSGGSCSRWSRIGLLEIATRLPARAPPSISGSIDDARFSKAGPDDPAHQPAHGGGDRGDDAGRRPIARESRFELAISAVALGRLRLQAGRGGVVLPMIVVIIARWLYWGRPSPYLLTAGGLRLPGDLLRLLPAHLPAPDDPIRGRTVRRSAAAPALLVKPLIPVYLALTTNFVALQGIVDHFPTVACFRARRLRRRSLRRFISAARDVGDVSGGLTPPWVTSTVAGAFWADGGFAVLVPGVAITGILAAGAYAAAARTCHVPLGAGCRLPTFLAIFGLYTNLWTQQIDWLIVTPLLFVFGAFAEDPQAPPGIVGAHGARSGACRHVNRQPRGGTPRPPREPTAGAGGHRISRGPVRPGRDRRPPGLRPDRPADPARTVPADQDHGLPQSVAGQKPSSATAAASMTTRCSGG